MAYLVPKAWAVMGWAVSDALRVFSIRTLAAAKETEANRNLIRAMLDGRKSRFLRTDFIL